MNTRLTNNQLHRHTDWLNWHILSREHVADCRIFSVNKLMAKNNEMPHKTGKFFTLSCNPWVNVIAVTADQEVLFVEQFRYGIEQVTLEIPGGTVEANDPSPRIAAERELREETGYIADDWHLLGQNHPNPAMQNNICYTYLAKNARQIETPQFDDTGTELINIRKVHLVDVWGLIADGTISHALVIAAFHFYSIHKTQEFDTK